MGEQQRRRVRTRSGVLAPLVGAVVLVAAACVPPAAAPAPTPASTGGPGGASSTAPGSRALLSRDVDHPPPPDCSQNRYTRPDPTTLPSELDPNGYKLSSAVDSRWGRSTHALCGSVGPGVDTAWGLTHGRDDVVIAVLDSGVEWRTAGKDQLADLADQAYINPGELPKPQGASTYDADGNGPVSAHD